MLQVTGLTPLPSAVLTTSTARLCHAWWLLGSPWVHCLLHSHSFLLPSPLPLTLHAVMHRSHLYASEERALTAFVTSPRDAWVSAAYEVQAPYHLVVCVCICVVSLCVYAHDMSLPSPPLPSPPFPLQLEGAHYMLVSSLAVFNFAQWKEHRVAFLKRLLVTAHARHISPSHITG